MIHQYRPQRRRRLETPLGTKEIGTIPIGTILRPHNCTSNVEVLAWIPRDYATYRNGRFATKRITGGHLAMVRNLSNGKISQISDAWLIDAPTFYGAA